MNEAAPKSPTWRDTRYRLIREFLALPAEALPSAAWVDDWYEVAGNAWNILYGMKNYFGNFPPELNFPDIQIRLHAAHEGWRDGVIIGNAPPRSRR